MVFEYGAITRWGSSFQMILLTISFVTPLLTHAFALQPPTVIAGDDYPPSTITIKFGLFPFRSPLLGEYLLVSFPPGTEMFHFPGYASAERQIVRVYLTGFPHSDITGSKLVWQLPDAYRSQTTSFIAFKSLGILHTPLNLEFHVRNSVNRIFSSTQEC